MIENSISENSSPERTIESPYLESVSSTLSLWLLHNLIGSENKRPQKHAATYLGIVKKHLIIFSCNIFTLFFGAIYAKIFHISSSSNDWLTVLNLVIALVPVLPAFFLPGDRISANKRRVLIVLHCLYSIGCSYVFGTSIVTEFDKFGPIVISVYGSSFLGFLYKGFARQTKNSWWITILIMLVPILGSFGYQAHRIHAIPWPGIMLALVFLVYIYTIYLSDLDGLRVATENHDLAKENEWFVASCLMFEVIFTIILVLGTDRRSDDEDDD
ncbi:hypothetical protein ACFQY8_07495 [Alloscardovia venturai]|uniref:Uncharacterized protein n=1 Tax=Alloscardovia venturai TaxID=1769421 RepID=A0ABW2Y7K5_9BIFI